MKKSTVRIICWVLAALMIFSVISVTIVSQIG